MAFGLLSQSLHIFVLIIMSCVAFAGEKPIMVFDMGKTISDHTEFDPVTDAFKREWYAPGAYEYLNRLKAQGFTLAMMINIPEEWGDTQERKLEKLKKVVRTGWDDPDHAAFDWTHFDFIFFPDNDLERKGTGNLIFYHKVIAALARVFGHRDVLFQGENPIEVAEARRAGMAAWDINRVGFSPPHYLPIEQIDDFLKTQRR